MRGRNHTLSNRIYCASILKSRAAVLLPSMASLSSSIQTRNIPRRNFCTLNNHLKARICRLPPMASTGATGGSASDGASGPSLHRGLNGRPLSLATKLAHCEGYVKDDFAGSMPPIYQSATFQQPDAVRLPPRCSRSNAACRPLLLPPQARSHAPGQHGRVRLQPQRQPHAQRAGANGGRPGGRQPRLCLQQWHGGTGGCHAAAGCGRPHRGGCAK